MTRLALPALVALVAGCAETTDAPPAAGTDNPAVTTPAERPTEVVDSTVTGFRFSIDGDAGPIASYALDGGGECIAYATHVVQLRPVDDEGSSQALALVARPDGTSPLDVCDAESEIELPYRPATDAFVALDGTTVWFTRDVRGQENLIGYDFEAGETIFEESVAWPVTKDAEGLTFGGPPEAMGSRAALDAAAVACPEADAWFEAGQPVAISRRLRFSFATGETADADEAVCFVEGEA